ncbi:GNAT family N-acetyltransferase [Trinickia acidisoli]|uniref:GNAT family N-acetyltransferase n=1 Tax=Trinickia acidisoli TaxID=2767482 RepID=UPI001A8F99E1|nr:GNAT family N-acetyltransferase [Trinickia acidisoli]
MADSLTFDHLDTPASFAAAFEIMKQLRPHLTDVNAFVAQLAHQHTEGYRLLAARDGTEVVGLAGYRAQTNLLRGKFIYVDDLVVNADLQRGGVGAQLLEAVRDVARNSGCAHLVLDTGLNNAFAQRFYFRQGLLATGMHFAEPLTLVTE